MSLLPAYMGELWKSYEQMHREDIASFDVTLLSVDPLKCHSSVLPFLAWEADVKIDGFSESVQRELIAGAFRALQYAGTIGAVKNILNSFNDIEVKEWSLYDGEPFHFKVDLKISSDIEKIYSRERFQKTEKLIDSNKNARSKFDGFNLKINADGSITLADSIVTDIQLSNKLTFEAINKDILLQSQNITTINLAKEIKPFIAIGNFRDSGASVSTVNLSNNITFQEIKTDFSLMAQNTTTINLSEEIKPYKVVGDLKKHCGGVMDINLGNELNYKGDAEMNLEIIGGVTWEF